MLPRPTALVADRSGTFSEPRTSTSTATCAEGLRWASATGGSGELGVRHRGAQAGGQRVGAAKGGLAGGRWGVRPAAAHLDNRHSNVGPRLPRHHPGVCQVELAQDDCDVPRRRLARVGRLLGASTEDRAPLGLLLLGLPAPGDARASGEPAGRRGPRPPWVRGRSATVTSCRGRARRRCSPRSCAAS